ncbi:type VI secretion protein [Aquipseudomonas campi]
MRQHYSAIALLTALIALAGCTGNYKFNDDQYRPLGDPHAVKRGN